MADPILRDKRFEIGVLFDVVEIKIHCGDDYEAQVVYDDIVDRMKKGESISLGIIGPKHRPELSGR